MKYIVLQTVMGGIVREFPVIFPQYMIHKDVSDAMTEVLKGYKYESVEPVSAGECNFINDEVNCDGDSSTLGIQSRGEQDDKLIRMFNYHHGLV